MGTPCAGYRTLMDPVTIVVVARDRIACTSDTLDHLLAITDERHPVLVVLGGVPPDMASQLDLRFAPRVAFRFEDHPLNPSEGRNIGLREATTELVAFIDTDVRPRAGWLEALVVCQRDTGAGIVVPVILERPDVIHCAGNDFYIDVHDGARMGHKTLRYFLKPYHEGSNLRRCEIDYGELHAHLVLRQAAIDLDVFDERITEVGEVDCALAMRVGGYTVWFEPSSVVLFDRFLPIDAADIDQYEMKWDPITMLEGLRVFYEKWGVDATEDGAFSGFLCETNALLGRLPRRVRTEWALRSSTMTRRAISGSLRAIQRARFALHARQYGGAEWDAWIEEARSRGVQPTHPDLPMLRTSCDVPTAAVPSPSRLDPAS